MKAPDVLSWLLGLLLDVLCSSSSPAPAAELPPATELPPLRLSLGRGWILEYWPAAAAAPRPRALGVLLGPRGCTWLAPSRRTRGARMRFLDLN